MTKRSPPSWMASIGLMLTALACGGDSGGAVALVTVDPQRPSTGAWTETGALAAATPAEAVGVDAEGRLRAVVSGQTFVVEAGALDLRQRYGDPGAPDRLGQVYRIRPRLAGGAWLATETGLWSADGLFVRHRPTDLTDPTVADVMEVDAGPLAGLWLAATDGVYWIATDTAQRIESERPAQKLAVSADAAALVSDGIVRILTTEAGELRIADAPFTDPVTDVAATFGALFVATEAGLYRYQDDAWTQYTLADDGAPAPVESLAVAGTSVWARTDTSVIRWADDSLTAFAALGTGPLAVDQLGDVYAPSPDGLARGSTGVLGDEVVTFTADVRPWIEAHCALCHANQTQDFRQVDVFRGVASEALTRVRSGDMPRCAGGVRCPPESYLSPDEYAVLEQWIRAGLPE